MLRTFLYKVFGAGTWEGDTELFEDKSARVARPLDSMRWKCSSVCVFCLSMMTMEEGSS
jgi:hypothetical protein